jgi:hypothetical protein
MSTNYSMKNNKTSRKTFTSIKATKVCRLMKWQDLSPHPKSAA